MDLFPLTRVLGLTTGILQCTLSTVAVCIGHHVVTLVLQVLPVSGRRVVFGSDASQSRDVKFAL